MALSASSPSSLNGERCGKDIFISYGREEAVKSFVKKLKSDLEAANLSVWLDEVDIPAGSEWPREIALALQDCRALIAVVTKKYVSSQYCKKELYVACGKHKEIFPIIYEDGWSNCEEGAGVSYMISSHNWTFFLSNKDYPASLQKLIGGLKGIRATSTPLQSPEASLSRSVVDRSCLSSESDTLYSPGSDAPDTPTLSSFQLRRLSDKPKLTELRSLKCHDGTKIDIVSSIAPAWTEFGILLEFDDIGEKIDLIDATYKIQGPVVCCTEMFKTWLKGAGRQPASWNIVVELLEDCERSSLAQQVKAALQD